jgi:signal transduction histidine kinase
VESVREISAHLHPHHIELLGFGPAVKAMVEKISRSTGLTIVYSCDSLDHQIPKEIEIHVYRIIQEGLSNIVWHASAQNVSVAIRKNLKSIEVRITDDGCGFNIHDVQRERSHEHAGDLSRGLGLASMSERARMIGGTLIIESVVSSGTTIRLEFPIS